MSSVPCPNCGNEIPSARLRYSALYCSNQCAKEADRIRRYGADYNVISAQSRGAVCELLVCADLLARNYEVFRAQSPACSCDLVGRGKGDLFRVEVRAGTRNLDGKLCYPWNQKDHGRSDLVAVVEPNGHITYIPDIPA